MPVQRARDVIEISIEVKCVKGGGISSHEEMKQSQGGELKNILQGLLNVVKEANKKTEWKDAVLKSIESNLGSMIANIEKIKEPKQVFGAEEAEKFKKDISEKEKHVRKYNSEPETSCCGLIKSKPKLPLEELEGLENSLQSFNTIIVKALQVQARNAKNAQSAAGHLENSSKPEQQTNKPISKPVVKESEKSGFVLNSSAMQLEVNGLNQKPEGLNLIEKKAMVPNNFTPSSIHVPPTAESETSKESKKEKDRALEVASSAMSNTITLSNKEKDAVSSAARGSVETASAKKIFQEAEVREESSYKGEKRKPFSS